MANSILFYLLVLFTTGVVDNQPLSDIFGSPSERNIYTPPTDGYQSIGGVGCGGGTIDMPNNGSEGSR